MDFTAAKEFILTKLETELDPRLTYHKVAHTIDVYESSIRIAELEGINEHEMTLLKTAALYHDSGMLDSYIDHEEASVVIVNKHLPGFGYSQTDIDEINKMIMTTKLPQSAKSYLEQIICDADLDYLGRNDFYMISHQLLYEWNILDINPMTLSQWYHLQIQFLGNHSYFTKAAQDTRNDLKMENLHGIKELLKP